jgi:hypothetical protein
LLNHRFALGITHGMGGYRIDAIESRPVPVRDSDELI